MSHFATKRVHPVTGKEKACIAMDDYFGKHQYGYRFEGEKTVYSEEELQALTPQKSYPDG